MKITIDRFEGNYAIVELKNKNTIDMPREIVPTGAKEGDVLEIIINRDETKARKKRIDKVMDSLWK